MRDLFDIREELKSLPKLPGVYIMKNELEEIIYVGKAVSLKNRVSQYFQSGKSHNQKTKVMVSNIDHFEYIITDTEMEALILEANLIKKHKPKYNILLRDDKQYPYIVVTTDERYPRVIKTRSKKKRGGRYFGPYTNATAVNDVIDIIGECYKLRTCSLNLDRGPRLKRPCLNYHIGKCPGPCFKEIDEIEYGEMVREVIMFLEGKGSKLVSEIESKMMAAAEKLEFEEAAKYRDRLESLRAIVEKQKIVRDDSLDQDVIGIARGVDEACVQIFYIRNGKIVGREDYMLDNTEGLSKGELLSSFIKQFYLTASHIPKEILVEEEFLDLELLEDWLSGLRGKKSHLTVPKRGERAELMEMVKKNAFESLKKNSTKIKASKDDGTLALEELKSCLGLEKTPIRIEAYDISNTQGVNSVGSMVVFQNGKSSKKDYRKFKIKYVKGPDDYSSLEEVLERRFRRGMEELEESKKRDIPIENFSVFPDLIMMDGGKGQVNTAKKVLKKLGFEIPVCGMVKDDAHRTRGLIYENEEIELAKSSSAFKLVSRIQDEAHRFAIGYHRELMNKQMIKSVLDTAPGIGAVRKKNLLAHFGSIANIKRADVVSLSKVEGMNLKVASELYEYFRKRQG